MKNFTERKEMKPWIYWAHCSYFYMYMTLLIQIKVTNLKKSEEILIRPLRLCLILKGILLKSCQEFNLGIVWNQLQVKWEEMTHHEDMAQKRMIRIVSRAMKLDWFSTGLSSRESRWPKSGKITTSFGAWLFFLLRLSLRSTKAPILCVSGKSRYHWFWRKQIKNSFPKFLQD